MKPFGRSNAMRDIATATLSGNLTRDIELRALPSGADVARLRVATTTRRRAGEEWVDKTNYFTVEVYGAQARSCAQYLRKGSRVFVDAELDWREWTDPDDKKREAVTFRARQVLFEGGRSARAAGADGSDQQNGAGSEAAALADGEPVGVSTPGAEGAASADDLPF
jgi:single-strand DNA-binding protein